MTRSAKLIAILALTLLVLVPIAMAGEGKECAGKDNPTFDESTYSIQVAEREAYQRELDRRARRRNG